jgi:uncharacterized membrane protein
MAQRRPLRTRISQDEYQLLLKLREQKPAQNPPSSPATLGDRISDKVAATIGSWNFIIIQTILLVAWVILNVTAYIQRWDPYPFILLNLMLSFQAAYSAPIIMMSQNRQSAVDRQDAKHDYAVNMKAELEIELLQDKVTLLHEDDIPQVITLLQQLQQRIDHIEHLLSQPQN